MNGRGWTVWDPDNGTEADGKRIHPSGAGAHCVRDAACIFAEKHAGFFEGDPFDKLTVHVRDKDDGKLYTVTIDVEMVAEFTPGPERLLP